MRAQAHQPHGQGVHLRLSLIALASTLAVLLSARDASAYCRMTTCLPGDESCPEDPDDGCVRGGAPAWWKRDVIPFRFAEDFPDHARDAFLRALARWSEVQCPATATTRAGRTGLRFLELPPSSDDDAAFVVSVSDGELSGEELGLTTVDFGEVSGQVKTARIAIDPAALSGDVDLDIVMTHEVGHYIGLAHSRVDDSVMEELYGSIESAELGADDRAAVCALYRPRDLRQLPPSCSAGQVGSPSSEPRIVTCAFGLAVAAMAARARIRPRAG